MSTPFFSIIVPTYNASNFIDRCIISIIDQSFRDWEMIIVNDCSQDDSIEKILKHEKNDTRIKVLENYENKGVSFSRNLGIKNAKGKYILFVDSDDDIADSLAFENIFNILKNKDIDILDLNFNFINGNKTIVKSSKFNHKIGITNGLYFMNQAESITTLVWNKVYSKSFLKNNNIVFSIRRYEDVSFVIESFTKAHRVMFTPILLYNYHMNENSFMTTIINNSKLQDCLNLVKDLEKISLEYRYNYGIKKVFHYSFIGFTKLYIKSNDEQFKKSIIKEFKPIYNKHRFEILKNKKLSFVIKVALFISPVFANQILLIKNRLLKK